MILLTSAMPVWPAFRQLVKLAGFFKSKHATNNRLMSIMIDFIAALLVRKGVTALMIFLVIQNVSI